MLSTWLVEVMTVTWRASLWDIAGHSAPVECMIFDAQTLTLAIAVGHEVTNGSLDSICHHLSLEKLVVAYLDNGVISWSLRHRQQLWTISPVSRRIIPDGRLLDHIASPIVHNVVIPAVVLDEANSHDNSLQQQHWNQNPIPVSGFGVLVSRQVFNKSQLQSKKIQVEPNSIMKPFLHKGIPVGACTPSPETSPRFILYPDTQHLECGEWLPECTYQWHQSQAHLHTELQAKGIQPPWIPIDQDVDSYLAQSSLKPCNVERPTQRNNRAKENAISRGLLPPILSLNGKQVLRQHSVWRKPTLSSYRGIGMVCVQEGGLVDYKGL
ncbi:hypothetical protein P692DRAFT_20820967 [Suillus brevipes Sb2]|nr:hypothetical protein P692DRAFT_20820967 [Suillus brevipes Sb2]